MLAFTTASVRSIVDERDGIQWLDVDVDGRSASAYSLTSVVGHLRTNDKVIINTNAVDLGLGTGGSHVVHWNLSNQNSNHIIEKPRGMKARYLSEQLLIAHLEESSELNVAENLAGLNVVSCFLHSQIAIVAATIKELMPKARIAFVMNDSASLPFALSNLSHQLVMSRLIDVTISCGQAFGAQYEAVTVPSALLACNGSFNIDVAIVGPGPGVMGTSSRLGFSSLSMVGDLHIAQAEGSFATLCLRASDSDTRERHRGISHHTRTVLRYLPNTIIGIPRLAEQYIDQEDLASMNAVTVDVPNSALKRLKSAGVDLSTMGRAADNDELFVATSEAAGVLIAQNHQHVV